MAVNKVFFGLDGLRRPFKIVFPFPFQVCINIKLRDKFSCKHASASESLGLVMYSCRRRLCRFVTSSYGKETLGIVYSLFGPVLDPVSFLPRFQLRGLFFLWLLPNGNLAQRVPLEPAAAAGNDGSAGGSFVPLLWVSSSGRKRRNPICQKHGPIRFFGRIGDTIQTTKLWRIQFYFPFTAEAAFWAF
jgi:hypothetical protein